jgi:hypothetical protein
MNDPMAPERVELGIERLLAAPRDLARSGAPLAPPTPLGQASAAHRELFEEYADILAVVARTALDWWRETVIARQRAAGDAERGEREAWLSRPAGPASYPGFVAFIRDYWLECSALNERSSESERVAPESFLVDWLRGTDRSLELGVVACMPYWPIGLAGGRWV